MTSAQFTDVAAADGSITLSNLVPVAGEGVETAYSVEVQILDNVGYTTDADYMWNGSSWDNVLTGEDASDVTIPAGQGLWVANFVGESVGFQSSGRVPTSDLNAALDTDFGAVAIGNPFPVSVTLGDIVPLAAEGVETAYSVEIQILDNAGYTTEADYMWNGSSWENVLTSEDASQVTFPAGQGLWVANFTGEAVSLYIPAPEL